MISVTGDHVVIPACRKPESRWKKETMRFTFVVPANNMPGRRQNGFTLIELTLVGVILGMVSLLCWPAVRGVSQRLVARAEEERQTARIRSGRERAVLTGREQTDGSMKFFPDGRVEVREK